MVSVTLSTVASEPTSAKVSFTIFSVCWHFGQPGPRILMSIMHLLFFLFVHDAAAHEIKIGGRPVGQHHGDTEYYIAEAHQRKSAHDVAHYAAAGNGRAGT